MRQYIIKFILLLSILATGLMIYGFSIGINSVQNKEAKPVKIKTSSEKENKKEDTKTLSIVGLGDSLTRGIGDDNGAGYFERLTKALQKKQNKVVVASNLAVSGAKSADLMSLLSEQGIQYTISKADVIFMTMGANDLSPGMTNVTEEVLLHYQPDIASFTAYSKEILTTIRTLNSNAPIYWIGLYNPYEGIAGYEKTGEAILQWNLALESVAFSFPNVMVVPSLDLFKGKVPEWLYIDKYHPNGNGYQAMADRLLPILLTDLKGEKE